MATSPHTLSPHFRQITVATGVSEEKQREHKAAGGDSLLPDLPRSSHSQTFKISQDTEKIHVTDESDTLRAVFEKGNDGQVLMVVRNAAGDEIAILKLKEKKETKKEDKNHTPVPKTETLKLYGHTPLFQGQVPKRKRTYNGPPPLYLWAQLEKKTAGLLGGSTKFLLHLPLLPHEVVYTIISRERQQQSLRLFQSLSQRALMSLPFQPWAAPAADATATPDAADATPRIQERKVTCQGRDCAVLRRLDGGEQAVTVLAGTDPMMMALFFAASNQLFEF